MLDTLGVNWGASQPEGLECTAIRDQQWCYVGEPVAVLGFEVQVCLIFGAGGLEAVTLEVPYSFIEELSQHYGVARPSGDLTCPQAPGWSPYEYRGSSREESCEWAVGTTVVMSDHLSTGSNFVTIVPARP